LSAKCRKNVLFRDPRARSAICATVVEVVPPFGEQVDGSHDESFARPWFPPSHRSIPR